MKKLLFLVLIFTLTACGAAPTAAPPAATQPPVIVEVTVVVPATSAPALATEVPPPAAPAATEAPIAMPENTATATLPPAVGADLLVNITRSGDNFSLKCSPSQLVFTATSASPYITGAEIWYRMVDKVTSMSSQWYAGGKMDSDGKGNFTRTFSALDLSPDVRVRANGWFEYQFVALNKGGDVVWRSEKVEKQVTFTKDCP